MKTGLAFVFVAVFSAVHSGYCAQILAVLHTPSYSHFVAGEAIVKALAAKGHKVTVVSPYPQKNPIPNYRDIELKGSREWFIERMSKVDLLQFGNANIYAKTKFPNDMGYEMAEIVYKNDGVIELINSGETFDAVIIEQFISESLYGLCYHFKASCISFSTVGSNLWTNRLVGNIGMASYIPDMSGYYSPKMNFFERMHNLATLLFQELVYHLDCLPRQDKLLHEHLPNSPPIQNLVYNISLVLLNSHNALTLAVPLTPNMVEIGGIHLQSMADTTLPEDVQNFLDKHNEGVVYFALGSNFRSTDLPPEKLKAIFDAIRKYGKPILWKFEDELPEGMDNVMVRKWFPQTAVLAHRNVKAFITHCGRLSSLESLYYGVPMIGVSLFAEQAHNAAEMDHLGFAIWVKFKSLTTDSLYNALVEITANPKYSNEAKLRSKAMQKENLIEKSTKWIEHIIEFKGASYLRNAGIDLPWYQFWMVDVIAFIILSILIVNSILGYVILKLYSYYNSKNKMASNRKSIKKPKQKSN